jgi:hypothetical protein
MKLLDEIIDLAVDNNSPLPTLLRKCLLLAHTLKNPRLQTWAEKELDGYDQVDELPDYRRIQAIARGVFFGPFNAQITNRPLPSMFLKPEHRRFAKEVLLAQPIAAYDMPLEQRSNQVVEWPPDLTTIYQGEFIRGYALHRAWQEIPSSAITALLDTIRNRILKFAIEIKDELGIVGGDISVIPQAKVEQSVTNYIYGGTNVISGTAHDFTQIGQISITPGDFEALSGRRSKENRRQ